MLTSLIMFIRRLFHRKKNVPGELFAEALRSENSGHFEEALISYEKALGEIRNTRFSDSNFKKKIIEKLKVLHTIINYKNNFYCGR